MFELFMLPEKRGFSIRGQESILDGSLRNGIPITHACGGKAKCSTCRIIVIEGLKNCTPRNENELKLSAKFHFTENVRLACQTNLMGPATVKRLIIDEVDIRILNEMQKLENRSLGEEKEATIMFVDIEGYTEFAEKAMAYDVIHMLNRYFFRMGEVVQHYNGFIMDYFGDGFLALFGHDEDEEHFFKAICAGLEMLAKMDVLNAYYFDLFERKFKIRLGLHTGKVILGTVGLSDMSKLAAIGDSVNMASRIEACNKKIGTNFLISEKLFRKTEKKILYDGPYQSELRGKSGLYNLYHVKGII